MSGSSAPLELSLVVVAGASRGKSLRLTPGTYRLGRDAQCELCIDDAKVSRTHLVIEVLKNSVRLVDNGSTGGSFFRNARFKELEVGAGATIRVGDTTLEIMTADADSLFGISGTSAASRKLIDQLKKAARTDVNVLLLGETGSGKEWCARAIHAASARAAQPMVVADLSTVGTEVIDSELFGHVKGAFTGALADRVGALERANGSTLFIDELSALPLEAQPRLLRFLEQRTLRPVGSNRERSVDVRVIAASQPDLEQRVAAGTFRRDLWFRLSVVTVHVPSLRDRLEDLDGLVDDLLRQFGHSSADITSQTRALLKSHAWPGNVRELRNVVQRAVALGKEQALGQTDEPAPERATTLRELKERIVSSFERDYLAGVIRENKGNIAAAARAAGVDRVHLYRLMRKYNLREPEE